MTRSPTRPALSGRLAPWPALLAAALLALGGGAHAATQTHSGNFKALGGDATAGWWPGGSDFNVNLLLFGVAPLFDPALGTLQKVSFALDGWRNLVGDCTTPAGAEGQGSCSARIDGFFHLEAHNYSGTPAPWVSMATINPVQTTFSVVSPLVGQTLGLQLQESRSAAGEITDAAALSTYFTEQGVNPSFHGIVLRFVPNDSGYYGSGFSTFWERLQWDADADFSISYHYAPIPEPGAAVLLLAGLAVVGWRGRRGRA
jgi:hypothetical protein